ncbi:carboxymuconolactone decarboxylase family protein [Rhodocytophaga aerolata]|uniref:Carboxymuconolactone decarboxylase family protein n=1 Tax=Rhodocytophaga aerolata TaxID=455078 RepID=A0ABT8RB26_9BACT|nr:carboxymuconolactone decarboxylase family protein [Rhodocytophaga aerolata]MDO1448408.1 carboxymuconolactone decarboxylase family protein [Rhodocytophaga aerolata]
METRLTPIEQPAGLMKLMYAFSKYLFGKVLSPLKIAYARLPLGFSLFSNKISRLEKKMVLKRELVLLIRHHVAQINTCSFCMDIGIAFALKAHQNTEKFYHLDELMTSPLYSDADRAALLFAQELTLEKKVSDATFGRAQHYFSDRELVEIAWIVSTEHYYNLMNLAFNIHSDNLCQLERMPGKKKEVEV